MEQATTNQIPAHLADRKKSPFKSIPIVIGALLFLVIGLMVWATVNTGAYYMTVDEVMAPNAVQQGQPIRVNGIVVGDSEEWNPEELTLKFRIYDENAPDDSGNQLAVVITGKPRPDNFQRAVSAIVEGEMQPDGTLQASKVMLKCPSRYEEGIEDVEEIIIIDATS